MPPADDELDDSDDSDSLLAAVARIPVVTAPAEWTPPTELDEYKLLEPLGKGGMGSVWLAHDRLLDRTVAIKFIAHGEPDQPTRERFAVEARAAARLQHPNVVSVYRYGEVAGRPYLVAEYIRGDSLDKLAKPVPWERALELGIALSRGLAAAHRHGIVHRDIKPANAILSLDGDAKLVDFGLARLEQVERPSQPAVELAAGSLDGGLTAPGAIAGTPRYLSPEVRRGEVAGRRSDVYGIGCVLYELVIGCAPILDLGGGTTVEAGGAERHPLQVRSLTGRLDAAANRFAEVVDRCLREDPDARYASGDELREALEDLRAPIAIGEMPEGNPYRGLVPFDAEHRALFFGRDADTRAVIERLRSDPFVLITGDSGAGKSSLCRAAVLPAIADGALGDGTAWTSVQLVPHHRPLTTLAMVLGPLVGSDGHDLVGLLTDEPSRLARELRKRRGPGTGVLVFVDQLEELCTISDRDEVAAFARVLSEIAAGGPGLRLLATVRSDFLTRVAELPSLGAEIARAIYLLRPLTTDGAREAIVGPAHARGASFESEQLVETLVGSTSGQGRIELPLLAFTLAQLWDARDPKTQTISAASLEAIGGVRGALARHADGVLEQLLPEQREVARKLLLRLVTADRTRARRSGAELAAFDRAVLDALVRSRLVVARGDDPPTFELAHERLIDGWPTLAAWVSNTAEAIAAHGRLATAVTDWERLGRTRDGLWGPRQLADLELLETEDLSRTEAEFAGASRRVVWRRRWLRRGIAIAIPLAALGLYVGAKLIARRDLDRHITEYSSAADASLATARTAAEASAKLRRDAFALFDKPDPEHAEPMWDQARQRAADAAAAYTQTTRSLESALLLDTGRSDVRHHLAEVLLEQAELAEQQYRLADRDELFERLAIFDPDGDVVARRSAPAHLTNAIAGTLEVVGPTAATLASGETRDVAPGSYVLVAHVDGKPITRQAVVAAPGAVLRADFEVPATVPTGYVYIPRGSVLYGSRDDEFLRRFYDAQPMHPREVGPFLISRTEATYAQWIEFLEALPKDQRDQRRPHAEASSEIPGGDLQLRAVDGTWELKMSPGGIAYTARVGAMIEYSDRTKRQRQDWLQFPVAGVSSDDAKEFAAWLDRSGKLPRARLCTDVEWERAARGADGRSYPHGEKLAPDDANIDVTYDRRDGGIGPDVVGSHPASNSVFDIADTSGNVWDLVLVDGRPVMRSGAFFINAIAAHLANHQAMPPGFRHPHMGLRLCADPPPIR